MTALLANVPVHADRSTVTPTTPVNGDERAELIADAEAEGALGERGSGHAPGLLGDREVGLRVEGHEGLPCRKPIRCGVRLRFSLMLS